MQLCNMSVVILYYIELQRYLSYILLDLATNLNDMADQFFIFLVFKYQFSQIRQQRDLFDCDVVLPEVVGIATHDASNAVVEAFGWFYSIPVDMTDLF